MLTTEQILDAAEDVLRKYGPRKITVVDVARALGVSHGTVYRHFATKAALHKAITIRWLERVTSPLAAISKKQSEPKKRLREWFETLMDIKHHRVNVDPEMFESYSSLAQKTTKHMAFEHIDILIKQIELILIDGNEDGSFDIEDCSFTARSLFFATVRYHHPLHANEWGDERIRDDFGHLFSLLERGIEKRE